MDGMRARDFLETVRQQHAMVKSRREALERTYEQIFSLKSPSLSEHVQNGTKKDLSDLLVAYEDRCEEYSAELLKMEQMNACAKALISTLPKVKWKAVLFNRFILDHTWETAADEVGIDESYVYRIAQQAFEYIEDSPQWKIVAEKL